MTRLARLRGLALLAALAAFMSIGAPIVGGGVARAEAASPTARGHDAIREQRFDEAWRLLMPLAVDGDVEAQFLVGLMFEQGFGVDADGASAREWYEKAARRGHTDAQFNLGMMFSEGRGGDQSSRVASIWFARAHLGGDPRGAMCLGMIYEGGAGVERSPQMALAWYGEASDDLMGASQSRERLARIVEPAMSPPPAPELDALPFMVETPDGPAVQLVWFPGEGAPAQRFFVEIVEIGDGPPKPVFTGYVDTTALTAPLPDADGDYAWRVLALSENGIYSGAGWERVNASRGGDAPMLAQGAEEHGFARYDIRLRHDAGDVAAASLGDALMDDLALANIPVSVIPVEAAPTETTVVYYFQQDREAAEAVAALMSLGPDQVAHRDFAEATAPGAIDVFIGRR